MDPLRSDHNMKSPMAWRLLYMAGLIATSAWTSLDVVVFGLVMLGTGLAIMSRKASLFVNASLSRSGDACQRCLTAHLLSFSLVHQLTCQQLDCGGSCGRGGFQKHSSVALPSRSADVADSRQQATPSQARDPRQSSPISQQLSMQDLPLGRVGLITCSFSESSWIPCFY